MNRTFLRQSMELDRSSAPDPAANVPLVSWVCGEPITRGGTPCRQRAGAGTSHLGRGPCHRHGGLTWSTDPDVTPFAELDAAVLVTFGKALELLEARRIRRQPIGELLAQLRDGGVP